MATSVKDMDPFLPPAWHDTVLDALRDGRGVIGTSSAELRRLHVGDRFVFAKGRITVGAIVPDDVVAWSEAHGVARCRTALGRAARSFRLASDARRAHGGTVGAPHRAVAGAGLPAEGSPSRSGHVPPPGRLGMAAGLDETWVRGVPGLPRSPTSGLPAHASIVRAPAPGLAERAAAGALHLQRARLPAAGRAP